MDTSLAINKLEIAKWIIDLDDKNILAEITRLMKHKKETHFYTEKEARRISKEKIAQRYTKPTYDAAYEATLSDKEKVKYWQEVGITGDELKKDLFEYIDSLPWKK